MYFWQFAFISGLHSGEDNIPGSWLEMESLGNIGSRRRVAGNHYSAEEQALDQIAKEVRDLFFNCVLNFLI